MPVGLLILFTLAPVVYAIFTSFTNYDIINPSKWVGLSNYTKMWKDPFFRLALKNTLVYTALYIPPGLLVTLGTALLLNRKRHFVSTFRVFFYLPVVASTVASATIWYWLLNPQEGLLNTVLRWFGVNGPAWLYDPNWAMVAIVIMSVWAGFGTNMLIMLGGLQSIPRELYEAARIDGASRYQSLRHVTVPGLQRPIFLVTALLIIRRAAGLRPGLHPHPGRPRQRNADDRLLHLQRRLPGPPHGLCLSHVGSPFSHHPRDITGQLEDNQPRPYGGSQAMTTATLHKAANAGKSAAWYVMVLFVSVLTVVPFLWTLTTSFKSPGEILQDPLHVLPLHFTWSNYSDVFSTVPFGRDILNSLIIAVVGVLTNCSFGALAGYTFAAPQVFPQRTDLCHLSCHDDDPQHCHNGANLHYLACVPACRWQ